MPGADGWGDSYWYSEQSLGWGCPGGFGRTVRLLPAGRSFNAVWPGVGRPPPAPRSGQGLRGCGGAAPQLGAATAVGGARRAECSGAGRGGVRRSEAEGGGARRGAAECGRSEAGCGGVRAAGCGRRVAAGGVTLRRAVAGCGGRRATAQSWPRRSWLERRDVAGPAVAGCGGRRAAAQSWPRRSWVERRDVAGGAWAGAGASNGSPAPGVDRAVRSAGELADHRSRGWPCRGSAARLIIFRAMSALRNWPTSPASRSMSMAFRSKASITFWYAPASRAAEDV
jgi:hypothetical protein